jgi:predicted DCC family thiol-disulfide oxidoreductase YuxK
MDDNTQISDSKASEVLATIYFDEKCFLCRNIAQLIGKMTPQTPYFLAPSLEPNPESISIHLRSGDTKTLVGPEAWRWLLENHPILGEIKWLAAKVGLTEETTALGMQRTTDFLKKLCSRC